MSPDADQTGPATGATRPLWGPVRAAGHAEPVCASPLDPPAGPGGPIVPAPGDAAWAAPPRPTAPAPPVHAALPMVAPEPSPLPPFGPPQAAPRPGGPGPARRSTPLLVAGVVAAVVVAVVGGVIGFGRSVPQQTATRAAPAATPERPRPTAAAQSSAQEASLTSPSGTVRILGPAAADPAAGAVLALLDRHFTAINTRDYAAWSSTVVDRRARDQPETRWMADYRSTRDSSVEVTAIDDAGSDAVAVTLSFVSEQDAADAPSDLSTGRICWESRWPVVDLSSGGRLDRPISGTTTRQACGAAA